MASGTLDLLPLPCAMLLYYARPMARETPGSQRWECGRRCFFKGEVRIQRHGLGTPGLVRVCCVGCAGSSRGIARTLCFVFCLLFACRLCVLCVPDRLLCVLCVWVTKVLKKYQNHWVPATMGCRHSAGTVMFWDTV